MQHLRDIPLARLAPGSARDRASFLGDFEALIGTPAEPRGRNRSGRRARPDMPPDRIPMRDLRILRGQGAGREAGDVGNKVVALCCLARVLLDPLLTVESGINGATGVDPGILPRSGRVIAANVVLGLVGLVGLLALYRSMREQGAAIACRAAAERTAGTVARWEDAPGAFAARAHRRHHAHRLSEERALDWFSAKLTMPILLAMVVGQVAQPAMPAALFGLAANDLARVVAALLRSEGALDRLRGHPPVDQLIARDAAFAPSSGRGGPGYFSAPGRVDPRLAAALHERLAAMHERLTALTGPARAYLARRRGLQRLSAVAWSSQCLGTFGMGVVSLGMLGALPLGSDALWRLGLGSGLGMAAGLALNGRAEAALTSHDHQPPIMKREAGLVAESIELLRRDGAVATEQRGGRELAIVVGVDSKLDDERRTVRKLIAAEANAAVAAGYARTLDAGIDAPGRWGRYVPARIAVGTYGLLSMGLDPRPPRWKKDNKRWYVRRAIAGIGGSEAALPALIAAIGRMANANRAYGILDRRDAPSAALAAAPAEAAQAEGEDTGAQRALRRLCRALLDAPMVKGDVLKLWSRDAATPAAGAPGRASAQFRTLRESGQCCPRDLEARKILDDIVAHYCEGNRTAPHAVRHVLDALTEATARTIAFAAPRKHATEIADAAELLVRGFLAQREAEEHHRASRLPFLNEAACGPAKPPDSSPPASSEIAGDADGRAYVVAIEDMTCGACTSAVEGAIRGLDWVAGGAGGVVVDLLAGSATVRASPGAGIDPASAMRALVEAVEDAGFDAAAA